jgi:hypothetical protein
VFVSEVNGSGHSGFPKAIIADSAGIACSSANDNMVEEFDIDRL